MNSQELAKIEQTQSMMMAPTSAAPSQHELASYKAMVSNALASGLYRGNEAEGIVKILMGRELGIPPMMALNAGVHNIKGKAEVSARSMMAMIRRAGHHVKVVQYDRTGCILEGKRADNGDTARVSFDLEDAKLAALTTDTWRKYPTDMCFARAVSRLARVLFADVIGTMYVEGETSDVIPVEILEKEVAEPVVDESAMLSEFVSRYPEEERESRRAYIRQLASKAKMSLQALIARATSNLDAFEGSYQHSRETAAA